MIRTARCFEPALPQDDAPIRALLRQSPMEGRLRLTLEREPAFVPALAERVHTFVYRDAAAGRILGLAQRSVSRVWLAGRARSLGYLSLLRRAPELTITRGVLQAGFAACESTRRADELSFDLTSILEENHAARRLLERGLPGLPRYERLCRFVTLTLDAGAARRPAPRRALEIRPGRADEAHAIAGFLARNLAHHPFACVWSADDLRSRGLSPQDFLLAIRARRIVACVALWDQRAFKQTVVRGYSAGLALLRVLLNPLPRWLGLPRLPAPGTVLSLAFLSHLALEEEDPELFIGLLAAGMAAARGRGIAYLALGLAEEHPLLAVARARVRARELRSLLYLVHPSGSASSGRPHGIPHVELARL